MVFFFNPAILEPFAWRAVWPRYFVIFLLHLPIYARIFARPSHLNPPFSILPSIHSFILLSPFTLHILQPFLCPYYYPILPLMRQKRLRSLV